MSGGDFWTLSPAEQSARLQNLAHQAVRQWGVSECDLELIKFRENAVFKMTPAEGDATVVRVHRQNYHSDASLQSELEWMAMLGERGIVVPLPVPTAAGDVMVKQSIDDVPGEWQVDMLSWLAGTQLGDIGEPLDLGDRERAAVFRNIGRTMARLHNFSERWPRQMQLTRHAWDGAGLVGDEPLWGRFWELEALTESQRTFLLQAKSAIAEDLQAYGQTGANYGLIHADLVPENVFVDGLEIQLIDFDDAGYGWHMFEVVTALYWLDAEPDYPEIMAAVFEGYRLERALSDADLAAFDLFVAARSLTYVGWVHTRSNTATAQEMAPLCIERAESFCARYLDQRGDS